MSTVEQPKCTLCGEPMQPGEEMFKLHGYSGPCPKPPLPKKADAWIEAAAKECADRVLVGAGEATFTEIIGRHAEGMMQTVMGRVGSLEKQLANPAIVPDPAAERLNPHERIG